MRRMNCLALALIATLGVTPGLLAGGYEITSFTVDGGGGTIAGDEWVLEGTIGQHDAGATLAGDEWVLTGGFWPAGSEEIDLCPADIDGDGLIGFADLIEVLANWGPCPPSCPQDLDGGGDVGFGDLLTVLAEWGVCP